MLKIFTDIFPELNSTFDSMDETEVRNEGFEELPAVEANMHSPRLDFHGQRVLVDDALYYLYDDYRNILYMSSLDGLIYRYDVESETFLETISVGAVLGEMALSADGSFLVVGELSGNGVGSPYPNQFVYHRVELETLQTETLVYSDTRVFDPVSRQLAIAADGSLYITSGGPGHTELFNFQDFENTPTYELLEGQGYDLGMTLDATIDGQFILIVESVVINTPFHLLRTSDNEIIATADLFDFGASGYNSDGSSINGEKQLIAVAVSGHLLVLDFEMNLLVNLNSSSYERSHSTAYFSSDGDQLFAFSGDNFSVQVYETQNFSFVGELLVSDSIGPGARLTGSIDGNYLFLTTRSGFISVDLATDLMLNVVGDSESNFLSGAVGSDTLFGDAGDDILNGKAGADSLNGGDGVDTATYTSSSQSVQVNLASGTATGGDAQGDTLVSIENLIGTRYNDTFIGNVQDNVFEGGAGSDSFDGGAGIDTATYENSNNRVVINLAANTAASGEATGDSFVSIENITGSRFGDVITGGTDDNVISGGFGNDVLAGFRGDDTILGGLGNDFMTGGAGADTIDGGEGNSDVVRYVGSDAGVNIDLGAGTAFGGHADGDTILNTEFVFGSSFDDVITGDALNNWLYGSVGDDTLDGGAGIDKLFGGSGADSFVFKAGNEFTFVTDFQDDVDVIDLSSYGYSDLSEALANMNQAGAHVRFFADGETLLILNATLEDIQDDIDIGLTV